MKREKINKNGIRDTDGTSVKLSLRDRLNIFIFGSRYNASNVTGKFHGPLGKLRAAFLINRAHHNWEKKDVPRLEAMKNIHAGGRRAFIICNGPSLNQMDFAPLKDEITFGVNAIYLNFEKMGFKPTYYVVEDNLVAEDRCLEINQLKGLTKFFSLRLAYSLKRDENTIFLNHHPEDRKVPRGKLNSPPGLKVKFSGDASIATYGGNTVTYTCLQLAFHFGIREVYIIGADHDFAVPQRYTQRDRDENFIIESEEDDVNHFARNYFGKGYRWHNPKLHKIEQAYQAARKFYEFNGGKIFNATIGGKLEVFERVDYNSLFAEGYENPLFKTFRLCYLNRSDIKTFDYNGGSIFFDGESVWEGNLEESHGISYKIEFVLKVEPTGNDYSSGYNEISPPMPLIVAPMRIYRVKNTTLIMYLDPELDFTFELPGNGWYHFKVIADQKREKTSVYINNRLVEQKNVFVPLGKRYSLGRGNLKRYWKGEFGYLSVELDPACKFPGSHLLLDTRGMEKQLQYAVGVKPLNYTGPWIDFTGQNKLDGVIKNRNGGAYTIVLFIKLETEDVDYTFSDTSPPMPLVIAPFALYQTKNNRLRVRSGDRFDCCFDLPESGWYRLTLDVNRGKETISLFINDFLWEEKKLFVPLGGKYSLGRGFLSRYWKGKLGNVRISRMDEYEKETVILEINEIKAAQP